MREVRTGIRNTISWFVCVALLSLAGGEAAGMSLPIQIDGRLDDWPAEAQILSDPVGDGGRSGIDVTSLWIANDERRLFLRLDFTREIHADESHDLTLYFDTDRDPNTGHAVAGSSFALGAELVWNLGARSGRIHKRGETRSLDLATFDVLIAPTVSSSRFEIALPYDTIVDGERIFAGPGFDLMIRDGEEGDLLHLSPPGYGFEPGVQPVTPIPPGRARADDVRIASYNIADDGLFLEPRRESLERIFRVIDPDVWVICEAWNHGALDLAARVEELLPSGPGKRWSGLKLDPGNGIVTRLPILASWPVLPDSRLTAVLLDLRPLHDSDLLVVANHFSCCDEDEERQQQADALVAFLRDARTPGGAIDLAEGTPMVAMGDFNLVGDRRPLVTLETGDIANQTAFGPDSPPDWDGSAFDIVEARHPEARLTHTWRDPQSGFYPGKLDYAFCTGSVSIVDRSFVLDTAELSSATLASYGLFHEDTETASDHAPLVVDLRPLERREDSDSTQAGPSEAAIRILSLAPDPFSSSTDLTYFLREPGWVAIEVFEPQGRRMRTIARRWQSGGEYRVSWNGRTDGGEMAPEGRYWIRIRSDHGNVSKGVTLSR